jgi:hypothetical protein
LRNTGRYGLITVQRHIGGPGVRPRFLLFAGTASAAVRAARGEKIMGYPPPDDQYRQQQRQPSFSPGPQDPPPQVQPSPHRELQQQQPYYDQAQMQPAVRDQRGYPPPVVQNHRRAAGKQYGLRGAESFWYVLGCIDFGMAYFAKLPTKKAACEVMSELQLDGQGPSNGYSLKGAETFWYVLMCLSFGAGYFAKVWAKKAMWEVVTMVHSAPSEYSDAISRALHGPATSGQPGY